MPIVENMRVGDLPKGDPVPEGIYRLRVVKVDRKVPEKTQKDPDPYQYYVIYNAICADENIPEEFHGRYVFDQMGPDPRGAWKLRQLAGALGYDEDFDIIAALDGNALVDAEYNAMVAIEKEKTGKDGKHYDARNVITKRMGLLD